MGLAARGEALKLCTIHKFQIEHRCATADAAKTTPAASRWAVSATRCATARLRPASWDRTDGRRTETTAGTDATTRRRAAADGSELRTTTRIGASVRAVAAGRRTTALRAAGDGRAAVRGAARARLCVARRRAAADGTRVRVAGRRAAAGPGLPVARRRAAGPGLSIARRTAADRCRICTAA